MKSIGAMIAQIEGLADADVTPWEREFIANVSHFTNSGKDTLGVSEKQAEIIERIYRKHFADAEA